MGVKTKTGFIWPTGGRVPARKNKPFVVNVAKNTHKSDFLTVICSHSPMLLCHLFRFIKQYIPNVWLSVNTLNSHSVVLQSLVLIIFGQSLLPVWKLKQLRNVILCKENREDPQRKSSHSPTHTHLWYRNTHILTPTHKSLPHRQTGTYTLTHILTYSHIQGWSRAWWETSDTQGGRRTGFSHI